MTDKYSDNVLPSRAIYPSRLVPYIAVLVVAKFLRSLGVFLSYDLLKYINIVQFLFIIKAGSAGCLIVLQKPFSSGKKISKHQWFRIGRHAFLGCCINLLWLFGLTLCGPLRALLLFEHSDLTVISGASALVSNVGGPSKFRGAVFFLLAVLGLLLFDHDDFRIDMETHGQGHHSNLINHLFNHLTHWTGLSDHKGGVVLLFLTLCASVGYSSAAKRLSVDVGGGKRLHALSTLASTVLMMPWAAFTYFTQEAQIESWLPYVIPLTLVILFVFIIDYYIEAVSLAKMEATRTAQFGTAAVLISAIVLSCLWSHPYTAQIRIDNGPLQEIVTEEHALSGGVIFSAILFLFATHILTSPGKGSRGSFIGYSAAGLPLYSFTGDTLQRTSHSMLNVFKSGLRAILDDSDSRKIFYFLCINLAFTFVELIYGVWTNSLGLISDGFHMLFDCSALVMGLYAAVMSRWKATRIFSYGYDRVEILSGFINGLFLMVIAFFVFTAAVTRIFDPPEVKTEKLMTVSVAGLLVNLIGIMVFKHSGHGHSHGGHGHSHGGHGHSHGGHGHGHGGHNTNMEGVFLHILADTLGSVGVIISSFLIEHFGWRVADPICSLFISILIFTSVLPLVKETSLILLLRTPEEMQKKLGKALEKISAMEGVVSCRKEHFWRHSSNIVCGTLHIQIKPEVTEQKIITHVSSLLREEGVQNLTVQVEKESYFQHMSGLGASVDQALESAKNHRTLNYKDSSNYIKAV